jgi:hypothetical protein
MVASAQRRVDRFTDPLSKPVGRQPFAECQHPLRPLGLRCDQVVAVDLEEGGQGGEGGSLVAFEKVLALGDSVRQHGALLGQVRISVVGVRLGPAERAVQASSSRSLL